jgi:5-deoxy-glucuronate isomerase
MTKTLVEVTPETAGWGFSGVRVEQLFPGDRFEWSTGDDEVLVVPLEGSCVVSGPAFRAELAGRASVFTGLTDVAYVPCHTPLTLAGAGRFALCTARASRALPFRHVTAAQTRVELRGAGQCSRQVNNIGTPDVLEADRLIVCEVLTPSGNFSSYPPHKHDEERHEEPKESVLEEIYYYEVRGERGVAYQRVYGTTEVLAEVRTGDVVLIPNGWHGPSIAVPGYDLYYLNVMAGPGERAWHICDDPAHAWIRDTWVGQPIDPRLPMTGVTS